MSYQPEMAGLDQRHLRSPEEIKALQGRFEGIKKGLQYKVDKKLLILAGTEAQVREGYRKTMKKNRLVQISLFQERNVTQGRPGLRQA